MKIRDIAFLALYAFLGLLVFLTRLFSLPLVVTAGIAVAVAVSIPIAQRVERVYDERQEKKIRRKRISELVNKWKKRSSEIGLSVELSDQAVGDFVAGDESPTLETIFEECVKEGFDGLNSYQRQIILILLLSREVEATDRAIEQAKLKSRIGSLMSNFDLGGLDQRTIELMGAYETVKYGRVNNLESAADLFDQDPDNPLELALEFATNYGTTEQLAIVLFNDRERSAELRKTLGRLIARGKIDTETINRETAERIKSEMDEIGNNATQFLVFDQRLHYDDEFTHAVEQFPHLQIGSKHPENGFPEAAQYMRIYMVYPDHDYGSADRFLEEVLKPAVQEDTLQEHPDAFVAVMPLELSTMTTYPEHDDIDEFLSGTHEALTFLETGSSEDISEIVSDQIVSDVGISELLSIIPFNVVAPQITDREKELIIDNYDEIQDRFGVNELFDWADIDPNKLGDVLTEFDNGENKDRWHDLSEKIIGQVEEYSAATFGSSIKKN